MSIVNVLVGIGFIFLVISIWLLATKEGKARLQKFSKPAKIVIFGITAITLMLAYLLSPLFHNIANPDTLGRRVTDPAKIGQVVAIEGYQIQVVTATFARNTHYAQGDRSQMFGTVRVTVDVVCTETTCPQGRLTLSVPGTDSDWTTIHDLSEGDQRTITLEEYPSAGVDASSSSLEFVISTPNLRYEAYFDLELDD